MININLLIITLEKKKVSRLRKEENYSRKEAMEMVYGEKS